MTTRPRAFSFVLAATGLALAGLLAAGTASAAGAKPSEAQLRYKQERAKCMRGESNQDRATCLKEAGAALQESKKRTTAAAGSGGGELAQNRLKRCETLPAQEREDCAARMNQGTTSGSAQTGGVLHELTVPAK
ncbi:hypothetical protein [Ramlibacter sp.]|uniref:hypothetical protein n=1 Tax=Ramlibacter sp. TaxID=1917967 RepID=UPI00183574C7|nr:hypothetical protein [Ramlibacter sp.]MBA2672304.1 hypothetical protein [Ramlibacter sp.]